MDICQEIKEIPGYEGYGSSRDGKIFLLETGEELSQEWDNGYKKVECLDGHLTKSLRVHRGVALAHIPNDDPITKWMVNHIDGIKYHNNITNLEWVTPYENNRHAILTGLRTDTIACKVRDYYTKEVKYFTSVGEASAFMGMRTYYASNYINRAFGHLINCRYEFKLASDKSEWFYENRNLLSRPSQYLCKVTDGKDSKEYFDSREFRIIFKLYDSPMSQSFPDLVAYARLIYPNKTFELWNAFDDNYYVRVKPKKNKEYHGLEISNGQTTKTFQSIREAAKYFHVDRDVIKARLKTGKKLGEWTFKRILPKLPPLVIVDK